MLYPAVPPPMVAYTSTHRALSLCLCHDVIMYMCTYHLCQREKTTIIVGMYITEVLTKTTTGKIAHRCILLCESYREHGKVKTRTLANLTHCPPYDVVALRWALQHKHDLLSPEDSARLLERLAHNALSADDRHRLAQLLQVLSASQGLSDPAVQPALQAASGQAKRPRTVGKPSRRCPRRWSPKERKL